MSGDTKRKAKNKQRKLFCSFLKLSIKPELNGEALETKAKTRVIATAKDEMEIN
jgi:hypothetical protein